MALTTTPRTVVLWSSYYAAFLLVAWLVVQPSTVEAHGAGCCNDPCVKPASCDCAPDECQGPHTQIHFFSDASCQTCRAGICWWFTDNHGIGEPCEFLCCNDDFAECIQEWPPQI